MALASAICCLLPAQTPQQSARDSATRDAGAESTVSLDPTELRALELKARGRTAAAAELLLTLLPGAASGAAWTPLEAARAEFRADLIAMLAARIGRTDLGERLAEFANSAQVAPYPGLGDRCRLHALMLADRAGRHTRAAELSAQLGFVTQWTIVGPFDNERGAGFQRALPPEVAPLDFDATYDGKKRQVAWRAMPTSVNPVDGVIDLDSMLRPADQVLAYATVALLAERDVDAALWLGSDESIKVFVNGREVFARDLRRRFAHDQDVALLPLRAGPNLLMLKICEQEGEWSFATRLRALDGSPLRDVRESSARVDLDAATKTAPREPDTAAQPHDLRAPLAASAAAGNAADAFRLASLLALQHPDDPTERRDHELAKAAVAAMPELPAAHVLLAFTRIRDGLSEERDENARRRDYERVVELDPEHAEALRALAEIELQNTGMAEHAASLLRRALAIEPRYTSARIALGDALSRLGMQDLADLEFHRATADGDDPLAIERSLDRHVATQRWPNALALVERRLATTFDAVAANDVAQLRLRVGDVEGAIEVLRRAIEHRPFSVVPYRRLADLQAAQLDYDSALATLGEWLRVCPEDDDALTAVAAIHALRGDVELQREILATVVDLNPNRKTERRALEFLQLDEKPFYHAFAIDPALIGSSADAVPADAAAAQDRYFYALRHDVVRAYRNGTTSRYHHQIVRVLTEQGARDLATFIVPHFYGEQRARLLGIRVQKSDGTELRPTLEGMYARLPPLAPGDVCDIRYRVDDLAPTFFGDYFGLEHAFAAPDGSPTGLARLDLVLDPGREYRMQVQSGAPEAESHLDQDGNLVHTFVVQDLPRRDIEELRPSLDESEPLVRVTTYRDWNEFSAWWWNLIRKQSEVSPDMRSKVEELVAGLDSERAKIEAIYRFVTTDIRYKAWEFGVHGYKPYSTAVIFERRHGDCKDKALLMNAMLGEVGIRAYPVLIYADPRRSADDLSLPMVQHFNHCISYLPPTDDRAGMYLDGTATYHPTDTLPEMDQGASVLVVQQGEGQVQDIAWVRAADNVDRRSYHVELDATGAALVTMTYEPQQNHAVRVREWLANEPAKRNENVERELASVFGRIELQSLETSDLLDLDEPVRVVAKFRVPQFAPLQNGALVLRSGYPQGSLQRLTSAKERDFALLLGVPSSSEQAVTYELPAGFRPIEIPPPVQLAPNFGTFASKWSQPKPGQLHLNRQQVLTTPRIEPAEYLEFREFAAQVDQADQRVVLLQRGEQ